MMFNFIFIVVIITMVLILEITNEIIEIKTLNLRKKKEE